MSPPAGALYAAALAGGGPLAARDERGARVPLALTRWLAEAGAADQRVLARARGPVLDVGCGPGRHVRALEARGVPALGLDASHAAVAIARARGAAVVAGDVFGPVPAAGRWRTVLLLDGNVGIGGDPAALLARCRRLGTDAGTVLCEVEPPGAGLIRGALRLEHRRRVSRAFPWARLGADALPAVAAAAGLDVAALWEDEGRWFAELR